MLTDEERIKIRESELLRREIQQELDKKPPESSVSKFFSHPAVLLVGSFLLVTWAGGCLASKWKQLEWRNQQNYLLRQRTLEKRYLMIDQLVRAVAETNTSAEDVLAGYTWNWKEAEVEERRKDWRVASRKWRIESKALLPKLSIYFQNDKIAGDFGKIIDDRRELGVIVTRLLTGSIKTEEESRSERKRAQELINTMTESLGACGREMAEEVKGLAPNLE